MVSSNSAIFALMAVCFVVMGAVGIKLLFHRDKRLNNYRARPIDVDEKLRATYSRNRTFFLIFVLACFSLWVVWQLRGIDNGAYAQFKPFYICFGLLFLGQLVIASFLKPFSLKHHKDNVKAFNTSIIVPVYNESETSLRHCLESMFYQTVMPDEIHVVDDGSSHHYDKTKKWFLSEGKAHGIATSWQKQKNLGKRHAHSKALQSVDNDGHKIIVTVDSDGLLDPHAIEEGLKPFIDPHVQSVAGLILAKNAQQNLLSRITDLIFVSAQQLIDRSAMSQFGSVLVNSGGLAFYRSNVVWEALENGYTDETFFDRQVNFSDDSFLTLFALLNGKAVQQPTAIVFADMPVNVSHHLRQQLRWNRGSFIRSWWRLRHLSINSVAWFRQLIGLMIFFSLTIILLQVFVVIPIRTGQLPPFEAFLIPILFGLLQYSRYFAVKRSDMSASSQLFSYVLTPIAILWSSLFLRFVRLYSFITCLKTGWGTRQKVEILHYNDEHA